MWHRMRRTGQIKSPVSINRLNDALKLSHQEDDDQLEDALLAATAFFEGPDGAGMALVQGTWVIVLDEFPCERIPIQPLISVDSVVYLDENDAQQTLPTTDYQFDIYSGRLVEGVDKSWPTLSRKINAVTITLQAGHTKDNPIPKDIERAIEALAAHFYENVEAVRDLNAIEVPLGAQSIIERYRRGQF